MVDEPMTIGELRQRIANIPDDMSIMGSDEGIYSWEAVCCRPMLLAPIPGGYRYQSLKKGGIPVSENDPGAELWFVL